MAVPDEKTSYKNVIYAIVVVVVVVIIGLACGAVFLIFKWVSAAYFVLFISYQPAYFLFTK